MSPERLLQYFEAISEAEDAVSRLRRLILALAVRGKLVEQDPQSEQVADIYIREPASEDFPANWRQLNFGKFCDIQGGNQPPKSQFVDELRPGYVRLFQIRDLGEGPVPTYIPEESTNRFCREGEILIGRYGASIGKIFWAQNGAYNVALAKFICPVSAFEPRFAFLMLKSGFFQGRLAGATRSAQAGFNKGDLAGIDFPLPPLAEQHRIVVKVDELMALCDELEAARAKRETRRDRLVAATLHRLSNDDTSRESGTLPTFKEAARFYFNHLPRLTTRPEHIKQLRQTILNLAVQGKLVPQDLRDRPAGELLVAIQEERRRKAQAERAKALKPLPPITADEVPYELPPGWAWERFGNIGETNIGLTYSPQNIADAGVPVLRANNIQNGKLDLSDLVRVAIEPKTSVLVKEGDLLICARSGSRALVGKAALIGQLQEKTAFGAFMAVFRSRLNEYLYYFICSPLFRQVIDEVNTTTINQITQNNLRSTLVSIPPLAEQRRIVAKVDELMALCAELETQLTTGATTRRQLLEATLHEALSA